MEQQIIFMTNAKRD